MEASRANRTKSLIGGFQDGSLEDPTFQSPCDVDLQDTRTTNSQRPPVAITSQQSEIGQKPPTRKSSGQSNMSTTIESNSSDASEIIAAEQFVQSSADSMTGNTTEGLFTEEAVSSYLNSNPSFVEKWMKEKLSADFGKELVLRGLLESHKGADVLSSSGSKISSNNHSPDHLSHMSIQCCSMKSASVYTKHSPKDGHTNRKISTKKAERLTEPELFMELIRDISTELEIDTLCHKILVNVGHLTHADRASLFLTHGSKNNKYLVAKLFDVTVDSRLEEALANAQENEILLPWGVGIVGHVASTKEVINIKDAYEDPRFNSAVDQQTGYKTMSVLCMPVCNFEGDVIGVAEIINKKNDSNEFSQQDVEVFKRYLAFCGIGIQNAQLFDMSMREYKRNQILLQLAQGIFEEQTSLDRLVTKIMTDSRELLKCERCAVYLLDTETLKTQSYAPSDRLSQLTSKKDSFLDEPPISSTSLMEECQESLDLRQEPDLPSPNQILNEKIKKHNFYTAFELRSNKKDCKIIRRSAKQLSTSPHIGLANYVCGVGKTINISDVQKWMGEPLEDEGLLTFSVLTVPIYNSTRNVLGIAQMINKENGLHFSEYDINTFEAFATFCGLGIQNTQVYEKACRLMARQKVALECLSYHATASKPDTDSLKQAEIPTATFYNLYSFDFTDFTLTDEETCKCAVKMFMELDLYEKFKIPYEVMCRWTLSVKKNYRPVKYHNWRHAVNVCQTMFAMLKTGKMERFMSDLEMLGLLVACLSHDLDHRGTNNSFQTKTDSPLAILYTTSTMEHHHFDQCVMILSQDSNNIFQSLSSEDYRTVMRVVESAILSTDMGLYFKKKDTFLDLSDNGEFDWQSPEKKELLCGMMMTACDVSAIAKPWEIQHRVAKLVADEFFEQGDLERLKLNQEPIAMMDREKKDELPKMQVGFINYICLPLYKALSESFPWVKPLYDGCNINREHWERLSEQVDMGLTWIDHEYIEKPVERNKTEIVRQITLQSKKRSENSSMDTCTHGTTTGCDRNQKQKRWLSGNLKKKISRTGSKKKSMEKSLENISLPKDCQGTSFTEGDTYEEDLMKISERKRKSKFDSCTIF